LKYKRFYILLFCFVFVLQLYAQDKNKAIALKTVLVAIENQHHVSFNYTENLVIDLEIAPPPIDFSLNEKLNYLESKTHLSFENINNRFITIYDKETEQKKLVCGYVFSEVDNLPLEKANVNFANGESCTTNKVGYFEIKTQKITDFIVSYVGFKNQKVLVSDFDPTCPKIILIPQITVLEEINTTQYLASGITKRQDESFVIKPKKFGILPGLIEPDVLQTMQQIPGINSADESVASINVRGGTHDQNLFLWNGIKMYQTGHFFGLISAFNPNLAHTINISKNGSSAFFGESVSSVIAISSDQNQSKKNSFSGGINMINADIYAKFNINKKGYLEITSRKSITDFAKSPTYDQYFTKAFQNTAVTDFGNNQNSVLKNDEKFSFYDITLKYAQNIGQRSRVVLDLITINDKLNVLQTSNFNTTLSSENNTLSQKNYGGNLFYQLNWNSKNSTAIALYGSSYELNAEKNRIQSNQTIRQENRVLDTGLKLENRHKLNSSINFNHGYQYNEIGVSNLDAVSSPLFFRNIKEVLRTHALILEGVYNDTIARVYLKTGLRINYSEQFKKMLFEPRLQFNYGFSKHFNLAILGELKSQNCFQIIDLQNDYFGIEKRRWILANDNTIPVEKSKQASLNLTFTKNNWLFSLEQFYKKINGITSVSQGFRNQLEFEKLVGDYEVLGVEMLLQKKTNHFITWISYTYNDNNYNFPKVVPPVFSNNFEIDHVISWSGSYEKNNFKIALGSKWHSGRPITTPSTAVVDNSLPTNPIISYNSPNNANLNDFFQVNFSATYKWKSANNIDYKLGLSVLNILNRKNEINEYYLVNTTTNTIGAVKNYALLRTPNLSFRVNF
jgi:hypothetical protein